MTGTHKGKGSLRSCLLPISLPFLFFLLSPFLARTQGPYPAGPDPDFHEGRREALRDSMEELSMAAFFSAPSRPRSKDIEHLYVQDRDFYYFTGCREKNAVLLIFSDSVSFDSIKTDELLFLPPRDPTDFVHLPGLGIQGAEDSLGIKKALTNKAFSDFKIRPERFDHIYWMNDKRGVIQGSMLDQLIKEFKQKTSSVEDRRSYEELHAWTASMREVKEDEELRFIQGAIDITAKAHKALMRRVEPGMWEYQGEALVEHVFRAHGASGPGFPSILGSGRNSCILHYNRNGDRMDSNEVMVVDIGAEYGGYSADITRTLPTDGDYSKEERAIYELVLKAQKAGIEACKPGNRFWDPHKAAQKVIAKGLVELGIISSAAGVRNYFMHGTSHYMGLDVHDAGSNGDLRPGTVLTVEPGIYIREGSNCDPKWWNIGVRIEDDILVTKNGPRNLSGSIPRNVDAIEALMKENSSFPKFEKIKPSTKEEKR